MSVYADRDSLINNWMKSLLSNALFAAAIILTILAAATLLPSDAPVLSDLGYKSRCPFAPWSTLTLLMLAGLAWIVRRHIESQQA